MNLALNDCRFAAGLAAMLFSGAGMTEPQWDQRFPGSDTTVHLVHLRGHNGDNEEKRAELRAMHAACVLRASSTGKSAEPLPGVLPAVPEPVQVRIYYGANRTMTHVYAKRFHVDPDSCRLVVRESESLMLASAVGKCKIDMKKKLARHHCNEEKHRSAPAFEGAVARGAFNPANGYGERTVTAPIGRKKLAGIRCDDFVYPDGRTGKCIANPPGSFAIPPSPFNAEYGGLLLELRSKFMTLEADSVQLNLRVSEKLFSIPAGVRVKSIAGGAP